MSNSSCAAWRTARIGRRPSSRKRATGSPTARTSRRASRPGRRTDRSARVGQRIVGDRVHGEVAARQILLQRLRRRSPTTGGGRPGTPLAAKGGHLDVARRRGVGQHRDRAVLAGRSGWRSVCRTAPSPPRGARRSRRRSRRAAAPAACRACRRPPDAPGARRRADGGRPRSTSPGMVRWHRGMRRGHGFAVSPPSSASSASGRRALLGLLLRPAAGAAVLAARRATAPPEPLVVVGAVLPTTS